MMSDLPMKDSCLVDHNFSCLCSLSMDGVKDETR